MILYCHSRMSDHHGDNESNRSCVNECAKIFMIYGAVIVIFYSPIIYSPAFIQCYFFIYILGDFCFLCAIGARYNCTHSIISAVLGYKAFGICYKPYGIFFRIFFHCLLIILAGVSLKPEDTQDTSALYLYTKVCRGLFQNVKGFHSTYNTYLKLSFIN